MKHLKTYQLFESKVHNYGEIYEMYRDCFIELSDLNAFIGVKNQANNTFDINTLIDGERGYRTDLENLWLMTEIRGQFPEKGYRNSPERLREIFNYLELELNNDEYQFHKMSGLRIQNFGIEVHIKEYDVYPTEDRWDKLRKDKNLKDYSHGGRVQYNREDDGRGYAKYTYQVGKSYPDVNFLQRLFKRKPTGQREVNYKFPVLTDKMEIQNLSVLHIITTGGFLG